MTGWERKILQIVRRINPDDPVNFLRNIVKDEARRKLDEKLSKCNLCSISSSSKTATYGSTNASIFILLDSALPEQDTAEAWDMLIATFQFYHIDLNDCFFMNAVNCCPYLKLEQEVLYRIPNLQEKESCKQYLVQAIEILKPKHMIILGNVALNSVVKANVDTIHGKVIDIMGIPAIATFSPGHLLRCKQHDPDRYECEKNIFFKDFEKISEEIHSVKE
jgi:uracil-DNA glycosylase family 4